MELGEVKSEARRELAVVVLAAGQGTRMKSDRAKVLHEICGVAMLGHIQRASRGLGAARLIVVVGSDADQVKQAFGSGAEFVVQAQQLGTGHAVMMAEPKLRDFSGDVLVLYGDTPLLRSETLERMQSLKESSGADLVILTAAGDIPGRVVRDSDERVSRIVEAQDASEQELAITERNTGVYLVSSRLLWEGLASIDTDNEQGELYVTDVVGFAVEHGYGVEALWLEDADECLGINTRAELSTAARIMQARINAAHMDNGVTLIDPASTYIDLGVEIGQDSLIEPGCYLMGETVIGSGVHIKANCYIEDSRLDDDVVFGPYSHLRPNSHLMSGVKVGNFVEVKNSTLGRGSKSAHLTYIGDATVGEGVNFGCGSIVVNYDGYQKHRTIIGDKSFIGCNVNLIAPVEIESNTFLAAGSTIMLGVPEDALGVARARQRNIEGWVARKEGRAPMRGAAPEKSAAKSEASAGKPVEKKPAGKKAARPKLSKKSTKKKTAKKKTAERKTARNKTSSKRGPVSKKAVKKAARKTSGAARRR